MPKAKSPSHATKLAPRRCWFEKSVANRRGTTSQWLLDALPAIVSIFRVVVGFVWLFEHQCKLSLFTSRLLQSRRAAHRAGELQEFAQKRSRPLPQPFAQFRASSVFWYGLCLFTCNTRLESRFSQTVESFTRLSCKIGRCCIFSGTVCMAYCLLVCTSSEM